MAREVGRDKEHREQPGRKLEVAVTMVTGQGAKNKETFKGPRPGESKVETEPI